MKKLRNALEEEKKQIQEDRVKLDIFKNELRTKQKTIETIRYEYIKATSQENMMHFANQAKDLAMYNLSKDTKIDSQGKHEPASGTGMISTNKELYPMSNIGSAG